MKSILRSCTALILIGGMCSCGSDAKLDKKSVNKKPVKEQTEVTTTKQAAETTETATAVPASQLVKTNINGEEFYEVDLSKEKIAVKTVKSSVTTKEVGGSSSETSYTTTTETTPRLVEVEPAPRPATVKTAPVYVEPATAVAAPTPSGNAKVKFDNDTHKYGIIMQGDEIEHKFEFTNTGSTELVITGAEASCGCTQPSYPFIPIPPGERGFIGVKFSSKGKLGPQKPTVTITTNAKPKTYKLYLDGFVDAERAKDQTPPGEGIIDETGN